MSYLPLSGSEICEMMNLPGDMASNKVWENHQYAIMAQMVKYATEEAYADAIAEEDEIIEITETTEDTEGTETIEGTDTPVVRSEYYPYMRLAYGYFALATVAHLINLKTVGEGIVKTVGLEAAQTALLSGDEVEQLSRTMELKGLNALGDYISSEGISRVKELTPAPKGFRIGVI